MNKNAFKNEKVKDFLRMIEAEPDISLKMLFEKFIEAIMKGERKVFLEDSIDNKGNGYYPRNIQTGSINLDVEVPRDRNGAFRPQILPDHWDRGDEEYKRLLLSLVESGYSERRVQSVLKKLGLCYDEEKMVKIKEELLREIKEFKSRELFSNWFAIFIDAYQTGVREESRVRKVQVYIVLGIDLRGNKDLLGFLVHFGAEKKSVWLELFRDLTSRGLKKVSLMVTDDFPGMGEAIKEIFPESKHQLCYVHLMRNIKRNLSREDAAIFIKELKLMRECSDYEEGSERFRELTGKFKDKYPHYMEYLLSKMENYLQFLNYPEEIRKYFYTTNLVESFNSLLERMRAEKGWHFQSKENLEIGILLTYRHLKTGSWWKPIPKLRGYEYELNRIHALQYAEDLL